MPKKGYTGITLKTEIAELLRQKAKESGLSINQYLLWLLNQKEAQIKSLLSLWPVGPRGFKSRTPRHFARFILTYIQGESILVVDYVELKIAI